MARTSIAQSGETSAEDEENLAPADGDVGTAPAEIEPGETPGDPLIADDPLIANDLLSGDDALIADDLGALGSEMLLFEDIPVVVTGARRAQAITRSSMPISIITSEDMKFRHHTSIPDMLRFTPGFDVIQIDRNRYSLGVRGLHQEYADRTLFLINGRHASNPLTGGVDFQHLPLFPDDIDRIEIVRGPGGAAWGANAFNGVVNVIPKDPSETQGVLASTQWSVYGDSFSQFRWGASEGDLDWRMSFGYEHHVSSEDAISNDSVVSRDFGRRYLFDGVGSYDLATGSELTFGLGITQFERGGTTLFGGGFADDEEFLGFRAFAKLEHELDNGDSFYVQWYGNFADNQRPELWNTFTSENDLEAQLDLTLGKNDEHQFSVGGNIRYVTIDLTGDPADIGFRSGYHDEVWLGAFMIDRWSVTESFTLESQIRVDHYTETQTDWSGRLTGLLALDDEQRHVVRAAAGRAFRAPATTLQDLNFRQGLLPSPPFPPDTFAVSGVGNGDLKNETVYLAELGYTVAWTKSLSSTFTGYYMWYEDLVSGRILDDPLMAGRLVAVVDNVDGGEGYGFEMTTKWKEDWGELGAWYAYNEIDREESIRPGIRSYFPAVHKVGASGRVHLFDWWTLDAVYSYNSPTSGRGGSPEVEDTHRMDLTSTFAILEGKGEIQVGLTDLFDDTEIVSQEPVSGPGAVTPGRTLFAGVKLRF